MQIYGYHRTSTKEQHLDRGIQEIERYCNEHEMALTNIFTDQETGKNFNRPRYTVLVEDVLRPGDILIVTELDRLGRNKYDTMQQIQRIKNMGVRLMVLELPTTLMDLSGALCFYGAGRAGEKGEATAGRDRSEEIAGRMG